MYRTFVKDLKFRLDENIHSSKYFKWKEALWLPKMQAYVLPNQEQIFNIIHLARELDKVRAYYDTPITITSWIRPQKYNDMIGGSPYSKHIIGKAVDFIIKGVSSSGIRQDLIDKKVPWSYRFELNDTPHVHLDTFGKGGFYA